MQLCDLLKSDMISYSIPIDETSATHPLILPEKISRSFEEIYDPITKIKVNLYKKQGAEVLKMLFYTLGKDKWVSCVNVKKIFLQEFLKKYTLSSATSENFLEIIKEKAGDEFYKMAKIWLENPGIPLITIEKSEKAGKFKIEQNRFLLSSKIQNKDHKKFPDWIIEINYTSLSDLESTQNFVLKKHSGIF